MTSETAPKQVKTEFYVRGSFLGADLWLQTAVETGGGTSRKTFRGSIAKESTLSLLDLANELFDGGLKLPPELPNIELSDISVELTTTSEDLPFEFSFSGKSTLSFGEKFSFLGITVTPPKGVVFNFKIAREVSENGQTKTYFFLGMSMAAGDALVVSSPLAWTRDLPGVDSLFREIQNDDESSSEDVVRLSLQANAAIALTLVETTLGQPGAASYFKDFDASAWQLTFGFLGLEFDLTPEGDAQPVSSSARMARMMTESRTGRVGPAPSSSDQGQEFTFPFLKQGEKPSVSNGAGQSGGLLNQLNQRITIRTPSFSDIKFEGTTISIAIPATIHIGPMDLDIALPVGFDIQSFAIRVNHIEGIQVFSKEPQFPKKQLLGLEWTFFGAEVAGQKAGEKRYHHFTLVTKDFNYQLQQAPGARIEIAYTKASQDPIVFIVRDFALSAKGLSITAEVSDRPARLNGIDTKYRFHGSQLRIVENRIQDFTLSGSGPLPPKLVGDATADISLQFKQVDGGLKLVAGAAQLRGNKILDCKGTRFQFSIDAIGLRFVNDSQFHLYFTLTGKARFVLASGDSRSGALALLPNIEIDLIDCPLTGDARVIAKHVKFLIELPKPVSFPFLGAYEYELRAIAFLPQFKPFGNDAAMQITGQIKFAQGKGDVASDKPDLHSLYIGLPEPGKFIPRLYMDRLPLELNAGEAFKLNGVVEFKDTEVLKGFEGEGVLEIKGLPPIAASFGFYRVRKSEDAPWVRAWFIYIEIRQVSFRIPVVEFYIREVGLGFGYRYTLVGIKRADEAGSLKQLLQELKVLSRTQGDLSRRDRWSLDLEDPGQDPRWTIVLRAMIAQLSAAPSPLTWNAPREEALPCVYLFDAVIAFRSDLTFFMNVRAWLNTSYGMFVKERNRGNNLQPLFSGFVFLWPRQKRFLAHLASNPNGHLGSRPPLPKFVESAIRSAQFSATLLIEPGLMHFELGWPNMLRWSNTIGPLQADIRGGFIFRISSTELVIGVSFLARASLKISASIDLGLVGASIEASASVAYGARYIGLVDFKTGTPAIYGAIGLEIRIRIAISLWIKIPLIFKTIKKSFNFSIDINFTAGLEFALNGLSEAGLRGQGTISVRAMGHRLQFSVRLSANPGAVTAARARTEKYLNIGLEATDVESVPGVQPADAGARVAPLRAAMLSTARRAGMAAGRRAEPIFDAPDYTVFVIREALDGYCYFVLLPRSQQDGGQPGFLPVPPDGSEALPEDHRDFRLLFENGEAFTFEQFNPHAVEGSERWSARTVSEANSAVEWRARWETEVIQDATEFQGDGNGGLEVTENQRLTLREYLRNAYLTTADPSSGAVIPLDDPDPLPADESLEDERVHNPTDNAFEAAVRGATEQFRGSPFFKWDPNQQYDQMLEQAFRQDTTIYDGEAGTGEVETAQQAQVDQNQQAHQVRSLVINDFMNDLRQYVDDPSARSRLESTSIAFQMGLVFRVQQGNRPTWLDDAVADDQAPKIYQRTTRTSSAPSNEPNHQRQVRTFNTRLTSFADNPPQFQRVRHFTDANTIAIAWALVQTYPAGANLTNLQRDPEHHLMYYEVRRRSLEGRDPEVVYKVKSAAVLHKTRNEEGQSILKRLQPRFQVVDHFTNETLDDLAALPATGRSYLYTITPIDFGGNAGHPLTLVATRFPNEPPRVPVDGELQVNYFLTEAAIQLHDAGSDQAPAPRLVNPAGCTVTWTEPPAAKTGPTVAIKDYYLIFRRETTLPIGSYGLDSSTQQPRTKLLPTSNSRPLPTDIKILLTPEGLPRARQAFVSLKTLHDVGVFPRSSRGWLHLGRTQLDWVGPRPTDEQRQVLNSLDGVSAFRSAIAQLLQRIDDPTQSQWSVELPTTVDRPEQVALPAAINLAVEWRPESWRVFFQTVSTNDVPSALAPVQLLLRVQSDAVKASDEAEERRPAELEWLPQPIKLALLPPQDQRSTVGTAHFPMPEEGSFQFDGTVDRVRYQPHPIGLRCLRFRWNQGPSHLPNYPLNLTASYDLLHLDIDAHTTETFRDASKLAQALRQIQEVQMISAEDQLLTPGDTLVTNQWEAWYPSAIRRRTLFTAQPIEGAQIPESPWYSWRESILEWPEWPGWTDTETGMRTDQLHPLLVELINRLGDPEGDYTADLQTVPPLQPQDFEAFLRSTAPEADFYGWSVLQRFGLTMAFSLRRKDNGHLVTGADLLTEIQQALNALEPGDQAAFYKHLSVELLFQPGRSINLSEADVDPNGLLGLIQVSLRPTVRQVLQYGRVRISGPAGGKAHLDLEFSQPFSLINQADPGSGQVEFESENGETTRVQRTLTIPLTGEVSLLLRGAALPTIRKDNSTPAKQQDNEAVVLDASAAVLSATDPLTPYFTIATEGLAEAFSTPGHPAQQQWLRFKRYAESLNGTDPGQADSEAQIGIPTAIADLEKQLPDFLEWSQRFFDRGGIVKEQDGLGQTGDGPWLVTAYPRAGSPAPAVPDASGRLTYDYLLQDQWAHNYRFYVRPNNRYGLLWQSLLKSPVLFPGNAGLPTDEIAQLVEATPETESGGLDVVLDRIHPIDPPVVLSSARLDPPAKPGQPVPPGKIWEVIVAQHREQALIERNQTLARQLAFRQVAFTLLRRFAEPDWLERLQALVQIQATPVEAQAHQVRIEWIESVLPALPAAYPAQPDHIDVTAPSPDEANIRSLDLPNRIGQFQQGALVLQWEALPFYYEHRLLLIAQTDQVVSPINRVTQRDFEYRSPDPVGLVQGQISVWTPPLPFPQTALEVRGRFLQIPLRRFWDSLPPEAQDRWPSEYPVVQISNQRSFSALPDPEVVYQIVEIFGGNIEVQAELLLGRDKADDREKYQVRQLGKRFLVQLVGLTPPQTLQTDTYATEYLLNVTLRQISEVSLQRVYEIADLPASTRDRTAFDNQTKILSVIDVFTRQDRNAFLLGSVEELRLFARYSTLSPDPVLEEGYTSRIVSTQPRLQDLASKVDYADVSTVIGRAHTLLALTGQLTAEQQAQLRSLANDCDVHLQHGLLALVNRQLEPNPAWGRIGRSPTALPPAEERWVAAVKPLESQEIPAALQPNLTLDEGSPRAEMTWTGSMTVAQQTALRGFIFDRAADQVRTFLEQAEVSAPYPEPPLIPSTSWPGTFAIASSGLNWTLRWTGALTAAEIEALLTLAGTGTLRTTMTSLIQRVLSGQRFDVNRLSAEAQANAQTWETNAIALDNQAAPKRSRIQQIDQLLPSTTDANARAALAAERAVLEQEVTVLESQAGSLRQQAAIARQQATDAQTQLNSALARFRVLTSDADANAIQPVPLSAPLSRTVFEASGQWRLQVSEVVNVLRARGHNDSADRVAQRLIIPADPAQPMQWRNAYDLDATVLREMRDATAPSDRFQMAFLQAFEGLMDQLQTAVRLTFAYRPLQSDCPAGLTTQLILQGHLLRCRTVLNQAERESLQQRFPTAVDQPSLTRLFADLQDRQTLDTLYQRWLSRVPISRWVALDSLGSLRQDVNIDYTLRWQGDLSETEQNQLEALEGDPPFKAAIARLITTLTTQKPKVATETVVLPDDQPPVLPAPLPEKLQLEWGIRYHGLMTIEEGRLLRNLFTEESDRQAIQDLFNASMTQSLRGGELKMMTRRGSATPSSMKFLTPESLG